MLKTGFCYYIPTHLNIHSSTLTKAFFFSMLINSFHIYRWFSCRYCVSLNSSGPKGIRKGSLMEYQFYNQWLQTLKMESRNRHAKTPAQFWQTLLKLSVKSLSHHNPIYLTSTIQIILSSFQERWSTVCSPYLDLTSLAAVLQPKSN